MSQAETVNFTITSETDITPESSKLNRNKTRTRSRRKKSNLLNEKNDSELLIYANNINGLTSKQDSLKLILEMVKPDIVALTETKLHLNSNFKIDGYEVIMSNLKLGKEGILIAAKKGTFCSIELIFESVNKNIATTEIKFPNDKIRVIVVHGPQEGDQSDIKSEFYNELDTEVQRCFFSESKLIITGDFNAKLEDNSDIGNARYLKAIIDKHQLSVLNFDCKTTGKWTRIQKRGDNEVRSVLDYIIVDELTCGSTQVL